jgi:F-type H+-transporting ATPase subunit b
MTDTILLLAAEGATPGETVNYFWLPHDINEVIWSSLAFFVVMGLLWKFAGKTVVEAFARRSANVSDELDAAASARLAAEAERDRIKVALADSESESARIIEEARATADQIAIDTAARAEADAVRVRERAAAELVALRAQAELDLSGELSRLSLGAAERVVASSLDDAAQQRLIDSYINQIGSQN